MEKCPYCEGRFAPAGGTLYECEDCGATFGIKIDLTRKIVYRKEEQMKLTSENYYSKEPGKEYFSASQVKSFYTCEAATVAEIEGEYERPSSSALMIGSYVDAFFEGSLGNFKALHPEIFNSRTGELKVDYKKADAMVARAYKDKVFMEYMEGDKQPIFTGDICGVPFKAKLDVYKEHVRIVDLKTVKDLEPVYKPGVGKVSPIEFWHWDLQMAIYQELVYQTTGEKLPCYLAIITKEDPSDIRLVQIPQDRLDVEMEVLKKDIMRMDAIKSGAIAPVRCERCAYCRATRVLTEPEIFSIETGEE